MATKTGCATCSDLSSLTRTINQIRDGQIAQTRELGIIIGQNRLILAELAGIAGAVGVGAAGDKLTKILAIISAVASTISAGAAVWSGLGKGELKKLLTETKKKANDSQYAATRASIKSEEIRKQNLVLGVKVAELAAQNLKGYEKANDAAYASAQASIKADKINENIVQMSKNQNENLTVISNDIVQVSNNLNNNLQTIFNKLSNNTLPVTTREVVREVIKEIPSEMRKITEPLTKQIERIRETANDDRKINNPIVRKIPELIKTVERGNSPVSQYQPKKIADDIKDNVVTSLRGINWNDIRPKVIYPDLEPIIAKHIDGSFSVYVQPDVRNIGDSQERIDKKVEEIKNKLAQQEKESQQVSPNIITEMKKLLNPQKESSDSPTKADLNSINDKLKEITSLITPLPALVSGLNPVKNPEIFNKISDAAATGVCRTTAPGGCMGKALNDLGDRNSQGLNNLGSKLDAANLASNAAQLALLKKIDATTVANGAKLGSQLANGGIGAKLVRIGDMLKLPQLLSVLTFISTIHNGIMLSTDFVQTLGALMDAGLQLILPKDSELGSISVQSILGKEFRAFLVNLIGVEQTNDLLQIWTKSSRIYQASASVVYNVTSLADSTKTITTSTLENLGKIGNALLDARVINPTAFPKMAEKITPNFVWDEKIAGLTAAATFLALIVGEAQNIKDETENLKENSAKLQTAINDATKPLKDLDKLKKSVSVTSENVDEIIDFGGLL